MALVVELERSVSDAEDALVERDWPKLGELLAEQRRTTHAIENALAETEGQRPPSFDAEFLRRIKSVENARDGQMRRLQAYNSAIGTRLSVMARAKVMRRTIAGAAEGRPSLINTTK